jgi:hypothetical protein
LEPGTLIRDADIRVGDWTGTIPEGFGPEEGGHRRARRDFLPSLAANPSWKPALALKGGGAGLAALIPKGMRAVAIRVNEIVGVAGFAVPGMRVDVLVSGSPPGEAALGGVTQTLLQNVQVLSAGQNFQKDAEGKPVSVPVVNLLVTPPQAEMLSSGQPTRPAFNWCCAIRWTMTSPKPPAARSRNCSIRARRSRSRIKAGQTGASPDPPYGSTRGVASGAQAARGRGDPRHQADGNAVRIAGEVRP